MTPSAAILLKGLFPLVVTLSLGFGASQALAASPAEAATALRGCSSYTCNLGCKRQGYDLGACTGPGNAVCQCFYY